MYRRGVKAAVLPAVGVHSRIAAELNLRVNDNRECTVLRVHPPAVRYNVKNHIAMCGILNLVGYRGRDHAVFIGHKGRGDKEYLFTGLIAGKRDTLIDLVKRSGYILLMNRKGVTVYIHFLLDNDVFLNTVTGHRILIVRAFLNTGKDHRVGSVLPFCQLLVHLRLNAFVSLLTVFLCRYCDTVHTAFNRKQLIIFFFPAEFCFEAMLTAYKVSAVFVLGKCVFYLLKGICVPVQYMNGFGIEHRLLRSVTHVEHLTVFFSEIQDLTHADSLFRFSFNRYSNVLVCLFIGSLLFFFR